MADEQLDDSLRHATHATTNIGIENERYCQRSLDHRHALW